MKIVLGIDEVGRGCWAGPLVAGAVILGPNFAVSNEVFRKFRDSKKMTKFHRREADKYIREFALEFGIGWVSALEVDQLGLTKAVGLAMRRAVEQISHDFTEVIIDGNINYLPEDSRSSALVKADDLVPAVSAASVIAKVARDAYMAKIALDHPNYGFEAHVGYGTKRHIEALAKYGPTALHRRSFKPIQAIL